MSNILSIWSDQNNVDLLKKLWEEDGLSCRLISEEFAKRGVAVGKNSIISKIHRLHLVPPATKKRAMRNRSSQENKIAKKRHRERPAKPLKVRGPTNEPIVIVPPSGAKAVLLRDSKDGQCKAIIGYKDGILANAIYCGEDAPWQVSKDGRKVPSSWCNYHKAKHFVERDR